MAPPSSETADFDFAERARHLTAMAVVSVEANPLINDGIRLSSTAAILAATHSPEISTGAFAGMTLAVEIAGALGASTLLSTEKGQTITRKLHRWAEKTRISRLASGVVPDAAITMTLGTSLMLANKQSQDPSRTAEQNRRYGIAMAAGVTAVAAAEIYAISEGLVSPGPVNVIGGVAALAVMTKGGDFVRKRIERNRHNKSATTYREYFDVHSGGPQVEGMSADEVKRALSDNRTITTTLVSGAQVPLLSPLTYNSEYNPGYFATHFLDQEAYYYSNFYGDEKVRQDLAGPSENLLQKLRLLADARAIVVTDVATTTKANGSSLEVLLENAGVPYERTHFNDNRNDEPCSTTHYAGKGRLTGNRLPEDKIAGNRRDAFRMMQQENPEQYNRLNGTALISPEEIDDELFEDIWALYEPQFNNLISENPSMQAQTKEDLLKTLRSNTSMLVCSFEDGKPICIGYFLTDMADVYWLRKEYYDKCFSDEHIWYFPGLAADTRHDGQGRSLSVIGLATELAYRQGIEPVITFQCTNVSKGYIPKIAKLGIERSRHFKIDFEERESYKCVGYRLGTTE